MSMKVLIKIEVQGCVCVPEARLCNSNNCFRALTVAGQLCACVCPRDRKCSETHHVSEDTQLFREVDKSSVSYLTGSRRF